MTSFSISLAHPAPEKDARLATLDPSAACIEALLDLRMRATAEARQDVRKPRSHTGGQTTRPTVSENSKKEWF
jgi:hypothetical protein